MAEELSIELTREGYGSTSDPDSMTTELEVTIAAKGNIGDANKLMRRIIKKHLMEDDVEIKSF